MSLFFSFVWISVREYVEIILNCYASLYGHTTPQLEEILVSKEIN